MPGPCRRRSSASVAACRRPRPCSRSRTSPTRSNAAAGPDARRHPGRRRGAPRRRGRRPGRPGAAPPPAAGAASPHASADPRRLDLGPARPAAARTTADTTAQAVADRIADRVRGVYGLGNTLAVPLIARDGMAGAIVLSRRSTEPWPEATRRLLQGRRRGGVLRDVARGLAPRRGAPRLHGRADRAPEPALLRRVLRACWRAAAGPRTRSAC